MSVVSRVWLNSDAYLVCLTHAMSNETEEIMGLCIGDTEETVNIYLYSYCYILRKFDKNFCFIIVTIIFDRIILHE